MNDVNIVCIKGNLVHDPVVKYLPGSNIACCNVAIANNRRRKDSSGAYVEKVNFIDVAVFGKQAENLAQYKHKGDPVLIEGTIEQDRWEDATTGRKGSKVGIKAIAVHWLPRAQSNGLPPEVGKVFPDAGPVDEGDIPF